MYTAQIEIINEGKNQIHTIGPGQFLIFGRGSGADVILNDRSVSKVHCKISDQRGKYIVEDLKSRNFTFLNKQKLEKPVILKNGDTITVGRTEIVFSMIKIQEKTAQFEIASIDSKAQEIVLKVQEEPKPQVKKQEPKKIPLTLKEDMIVRIALSLPHHPISQDKIQECLNLKQYSNKNILELLKEKKYISGVDVKMIEATIKNIFSHEEIEEEENVEPTNQTEKEDRLFIRMAQNKGWINVAQVQACVLMQRKYRKQKKYLRIYDILQKENCLKAEQVKRIHQEMGLGEEIPYKISGYKLISLIGVGGMGSIYKAKQISMDRIVAIKILSEAYRNNKYLNDLFLKEARAVARLNHENIIAGYDFGETKGISFFVMEHVDGPSLQEYLRRNGGRVNIDEALNIIIQLARALEHAWQKGLIHRDIKPENILLSENKTVKLCDLGLAQRTDQENMVKRKKDFGTPAYMSPEQIRCEPDIDIRSDIYSSGVAFYRIVFGMLPFSGTTSEIMSKHLGENLKFPTQGMNKEKMECAKIIKKMMAKDKKSRFQTPSLLLKSLANLKHKINEGSNIEATIEVAINQPKLKKPKRHTLFFKGLGRRKRKN